MIEQMLLGLVAYRVGKKIHYDGVKGCVTDCPEANELLRRKYAKAGRWTAEAGNKSEIRISKSEISKKSKRQKPRTTMVLVI